MATELQLAFARAEYFRLCKLLRIWGVAYATPGDAEAMEMGYDALCAVNESLQALMPKRRYH